MEKKGGIEAIANQLLSDDEIQQQSKIYHALSNPIRLKILKLLDSQLLCVCLIKEVVQIPDSKLSYHLEILTESGLIEGKRKGSWIIYNITESSGKFII